MGKKREMRIPSTLLEINKVEQFVEEMSELYHLNDSYFGNIIVALTEAVKNSIIHGNRSDESKNVHIVAESRPEGLLFSVIDQGIGFPYKNFENLDSLLADEALEGRGIILIHTLADEVRFSNKGRVIQILFKITGIDNDIYEKRSRQMLNYFRKKKEIPTNLDN